MKTALLYTLALSCTTLIGAAKLQAQAASADTDKQFLMTASQGDYTEIKFSQLAADKATNPRVRPTQTRWWQTTTRLKRR